MSAVSAEISAIVLHLMFSGSVGDDNQIKANQAQLVSRYSADYTVRSIGYPSGPDAVALLEKNLADPKKEAERHVILLSGSYGFQFRTKEEVQKLLKDLDKRSVVVVWTGHQHPAGLIKQSALFNIVGLPQFIIKRKPEFLEKFGKQLVSMQTVPNTLQLEDLQGALEKWNDAYQEAEEGINAADAREGVIGVFLGGSAPEPEDEGGRYQHDNLDAIYQRGLKIGQFAEQRDMPLWIVGNPRAGNFYPESSNPRDPVLRQRNKRDWIPFDKLTVEQQTLTASKWASMKELDQKRASEFLAHFPYAPLDPETAAFVRGVTESGCHFQVFDFTKIPGSSPKSAYRAVIAGLRLSAKSLALYSGESVSYGSDIGTFVAHTYAFHTPAMTWVHEGALDSLSALHMIGVWNLEEEPPHIDLAKKNESIRKGGQPDAGRIAEAVGSFLNLKQPKAEAEVVEVKARAEAKAEGERSEVLKHDVISEDSPKLQPAIPQVPVDSPLAQGPPILPQYSSQQGKISPLPEGSSPQQHMHEPDVSGGGKAKVAL